MKPHPPKDDRTQLLPPIRLYIEELDQLVEIATQRGFEVRLWDDAYTYDSIDELKQDRAGASIEPFYMRLTKNQRSWIQVKVSQSWTVASMNQWGEDEDVMAAVYGRLQSVLAQRVSVLHRVTANPWISGALFGGGFTSLVFAVINRDRSSVAQSLVWLVAMASFGLAVLWVKSTAGLFMVRRRDRPTFWRAHGWELAKDVMLLAAGAAITLLAQWLSMVL
jgi:hypothetical protein